MAHDVRSESTRKRIPVIAWAHGTSGVARRCAPSLMKDVEYGTEGLMPMVAAGFAVVATDSAGLGRAISVAGDMDFEAFESHDARVFDAGADLYWPFTALGIHAAYPDFDVRQMLTRPIEFVHVAGLDHDPLMEQTTPRRIE